MLPSSINGSTSPSAATFKPAQAHPNRHGHHSHANHSASTTTTTITTTTTSTVEISGGSRALMSDKATGVAAYQEVGGVQAVVDKSVENNPYAQTIISFIGLQLERDLAAGASPEELQSRLEAGLKGFEEGYSEAFKQLKDSGLLGDGVKEAIEETYSQVTAGISKLAEKYGLESPKVNDTELVPVVAPNPVQANQSVTTISSKTVVEERFSKNHRDLQTIQHMQKVAQKANTYEHLGKTKSDRVSKAYSYTVAESRGFSFKLRTQDGDEVTVNISNSQMGTSHLQIPKSGKGSDSEVAIFGDQSSDYQLNIDGELDAAELDAISELLSQIGDISEVFYSGDMDSALDMASHIDFNLDELSSFSLNLDMSSSEQSTVTNQTRRAGLGGFTPSALASFEPFMHQVQKAGDMAERMGQSRMIVPDMMEWLGRTEHASDSRTSLFAPMARAVI